jgi:NitT/TauT family transport system substrate-binding protein/sulfonate transport system substrate-binding protein
MFLGSLATAAALAGVARAKADTLEIRIGAATSVDHAPVFVGVERGIFAAHGLDAKVVMYQTGVEMINGLLNGAQEVNVMGSVPFLSGVANGFPLVLIAHLHGDATADSYAPNESVVVGPGSGIGEGEVAKLKGKRLGLPRGSGAEGYALGVLSEAGLQQSDVTIVNISPAELGTALQNKDVDAIVIWEPWGSLAVAKVQGAVRIIAGHCETVYDPGTVLTSQPVVASSSEKLQRFALAFFEAQQWVRKNEDAAAAIDMHWIQGIDIAVMKQAIRHSIYDGRISRLTAAMYKKKAIPFLLSQKKIRAAFDPSPAIDASFYLAAQAQAPQYFADLPPIPPDLQLK